MALSGAQRRELKARAHKLKAVVQTGGKGVTAAVLAEADAAIEHHELIKLRLAGIEREARDEVVKSLARDLRAEVVGVIGAVVILYRPARDKPKKPG